MPEGASREAEIQRELSVLDKTIAEVEVALADLACRLNSVVRIEPPTPETASKLEPETTTPLSARIHGITDRITCGLNLLRSLLARLEL